MTSDYGIPSEKRQTHFIEEVNTLFVPQMCVGEAPIPANVQSHQ